VLRLTTLCKHITMDRVTSRVRFGGSWVMNRELHAGGWQTTTRQVPDTRFLYGYVTVGLPPELPRQSFVH
jgi:hypothetical protein